MINADSPAALPSTAGPMATSHNIDSEAENYFDSKAWLGSDSEDEFFGVKGKGRKNNSTCQDNTATSGSPSQGSSLIESPPFIKAISNSNQEPPLTEEKKELVELFQDPFWSDLLVQKEKELVQFFQDWSWSEQSIMDQSSLSKTPCIVDRKSLEPSILDLPSDGSEEAQKDTGKSTGCCIPSFSPRLNFRKKKRPEAWL